MSDETDIILTSKLTGKRCMVTFKNPQTIPLNTYHLLTEDESNPIGAPKQIPNSAIIGTTLIGLNWVLIFSSDGKQHLIPRENILSIIPEDADIKDVKDKKTKNQNPENNNINNPNGVDKNANGKRK